MDQITDLRELLKHELKDLYSAETQIIDGLPKMIEKAKSPQLKKAFSDHLKVTRDQKKRLEKIQDILEIVNETKEEGGGFFANLFKSKEGEQHCKAMEGLIKEGESIMSEDMEPDVMDAALIAAAQKIEHYEIGSYGTARAYAEQMGMKEVESLLRQTLDEEYFADDSLTKIAIERVNIKAEGATGETTVIEKDNSKSNGRQAAPKKSAAKKTVSKNAPSKTAAKKSSVTKSAGKKSAPKKAAAKKSVPKKAAVKKSAPKKAVAKKTAPKKATAKKAAVKKSAPKKSAAKKAAPKKVASKKSASKKSAPKKSANRSSATKKSAPKKSAVKKSGGNRMVKKAAPKKAAVKKGVPKKSTGRSTPAKKSAPKKSPAKKSAAKKSSRRR